MICSSGVGFDPIHRTAGGDDRLTFGFHGIWQGVAVLYDKQTKSLWMHLTGECIDGPLEGATLPLISGRHVQWQEWKRDHPDTQVMGEDYSFSRDYFAEPSARRGVDFFPRGFQETIDARDDRLAPSALLYGVIVGDNQRAYPFERLTQVDGGVVNDVLGDTPLVIMFDQQTRSAVGYGRQLGDQRLEFSRDADGAFVDSTTGSRFDAAGRCTQGSLSGQSLPLILGIQAEWYGWYATYPDTTLFAVAPE